MSAGQKFAARFALPLFAIALAVGLVLCTETRVRGLLLNTLLLAAGTCAISLPVGTVLALVVVKTDLVGRRLLAVLLGILLFVPLYLKAGAWDAGFGLQGSVTLAYKIPPLLEGWRAVIWIHAMAAVPWVALIVGVGLRAVEPELEEEALLDAAPGQVFLRVTLRRAGAAAVFAALWVAVVCAAEMTVTDLFQIRTYAEEIYTGLNLEGWLDERPLGIGSGALVTALLVAAAMILCVRLAPNLGQVPVRAAWVWQLGRGRLAVSVVVWAGVVAMVGLPLANLAYKAGILVTPTETGLVRAWSPAKAVMMTLESPGEHRRELGWSVTIAVCAAVAAVVVATLLAWLARSGGLRSVPALVTTAVCLATPGPIVGLALIWLLNRPEVPGLVYLYDRTILAPWLAQTVRALPLATLVVWHALATVSDETLESAASEGAGSLARLWHIALPNRWGAVAAAVLIAFVIALGELSATLLVLPPGVTTLPVRIFGLIHYGVDDRVAGICLAIAAVGSLVAVVVVVLLRNKRSHTANPSRGPTARGH